MTELNIVGECAGANKVKDLITQLYPAEEENKKFHHTIQHIVRDQVFDNPSQKEVVECCFDCWQHLYCIQLKGQ